MLGALAAAVLLSIVLPADFMAEYGHYTALVIGIASGTWAQEKAKGMREEADAELERKVSEIGEEP